MTRFCREIAKPISPADEYLDYIPTQAVAEYLVRHHDFKRDGALESIEAIIFQSAQFPQGRNIALLGDAAQVRGPERELKQQGHKPSESFTDIFETLVRTLPQASNSAIRLVDGSVEVRRVTAARYDSEEGSSAIHDEDLNDLD